MNKKVLGKKFSRDTTSRRAMFRALIRSFVINQKIVTTYAKAKVLLPVVENLIYRARSKKLSTRRAIYKYLGNNREVTEKFFVIATKLPDLKGGYLRFINLPARKGDNVPMVRLEFAQKLESTEINKDMARGNKTLSIKNKQEEALKDKEMVGKSPASVLNKLSLKRKPTKNI